MKEINREYWRNRWEQGDTPWDAGSATEPLKRIALELAGPDTRILIPGAGNAYEAEYLHGKGFKHVTVLDIAPEPLEKIRQRNPDFPVENLVHGDFFTHQGKYGLILEQTFFCAIDPKRRAEYARKAYDLLDDGGYVAGVLFEGNMGKDEPPFGGTEAEYRSYFSAFEIVRLQRCPDSIKPRAGRELELRLRKKV